MARENKRKRDERRFGRSGTLADAICDPDSEWAQMPYWGPEDKEEVGGWVKSLRSHIPNSKVIVADNVSEYYFATSSKEFWDINEDINCAAPPFENVFIEMRRPSRITCGKKVGEFDPNLSRMGYLLLSSRTDDLVAEATRGANHAKILERHEKERAWLWENCDRHAVLALPYSPDPREAFEKLGLAEKEFVVKSRFIDRMRDPEQCKEELGKVEKGGWLVQFTLVSELRNGVILGPILGGTVVLDLGGRPAGRVSFTMPAIQKLIGTPQLEEMKSGINDTVIPALLALCFMNCKNVSTVPVDPCPRFNRERKKAGLKPLTRYHTILIEQAERHASGDCEPSGSRMGMHIRRGHFSTYTADRPLFGRHAGTFWVPSHVVGSARNGVVISDYNVAPATQ